MRVPLAIDLPSDFCARAPLLVALVERRKGDDQAIVIVEVSHASRIIDRS